MAKKFFNSGKIPKFKNYISDLEFEKWEAIKSSINISGPYGYLVGETPSIAYPTEILDSLYKKNKLTVPDKLAKHWFNGKTLFVSGLIDHKPENKKFDVQIAVSNVSTIETLKNKLGIPVFNLKNKIYLSINVDIDCDVWNILDKFVYKINKLTDDDVSIIGKPAYLEKKAVDFVLRHDNRLIELDRNLLKESVLERFLKRSKVKISKLVDLTSDVPENFEQITVQELQKSLLVNNGIHLVSGGDSFGETIKLDIGIKSLPEPVRENHKPYCSLISAFPQEKLKEGCSTLHEAASAECKKSTETNKQLLMSSSEAKASTEEEPRDGVPSIGSLDQAEQTTKNNQVPISSFIVSPKETNQKKLKEQLAFVYQQGTNRQEKFCYTQFKEGKYTRKRYLTEDKFVYYSLAFINCCLFSKNGTVSIKFIKQNFKNLSSDLKWNNDDFYYVRNMLLNIGIVECTSKSYKVGTYSKSYQLIKGNLSRFCLEAMSYHFPII